MLHFYLDNEIKEAGQDFLKNHPPDHHWYEAKHPNGSLSLQCSRQEQTIRTHFRSGHLRLLRMKTKFSRLVLGVLPARHL
ncbi:hypothetical protein TNCV_817461 [Trichonephila clavipes]|nr:hypothetical protein TNCV_817461 [Trichonephila clavipes]